MGQPARAVRLEGTRGPLSTQESKAILARLESRGAETAIFDRHLALEEGVAGSPLTIGNRVGLLQDGPATYSAMFAAIAGARDHIHMETYIIEDDEVGRKFSAALIARQAQGVAVALIYDSVGSIATPQAFFRNLTDNGVKVVEYNPINPVTAKWGWEVNQRDHRKLLIVDGRSAFLGGVNISSVYSGGSSKGRPAGNLPWRDTHLRVDGPVVAEFQKLYLETWAKQRGLPLAPRNHFPAPGAVGGELVRAIGSSPDEPYSLIYATLVSAIGAAESSVFLTNAYFVPDPQLLTALKNAAGRGVDVRIILPSSTDSWLVFNAGRSYYAELLAAGVKVYERRDALLHAKTAVIDGVWSTVGSTNLDWRSFLYNDEVNAVILGLEFGAQMRQVFEADILASDAITPERWRARAIGDHARETAARIWAYWL
ncbi:MAG: cardiolipin synthase [Pseudomonadota bacterium]|nr:cardiolipin synthase [Pseudomonadota bacterium]